MEDEERMEFIMEHYRHPHNSGVIENPTEEITEYNPVCGDAVKVSLLIKEHRVKEIKFVGRGCSISQASASILTDEVMGKSLEDLKKLTEKEHLDLIGIRLGPSREKCALISFNALKKILVKYGDE
ncbi:iron-sulfur cluster assembly scaffold protein [Oxyplasma meridianum]|uniref:Iron-sulfur cluster assembly scaffold protein n=1 Tax=Oxyplasma meridianum TaxID=3073602 RepID=A0AAX4NG31_9ARCH